VHLDESCHTQNWVTSRVWMSWLCFHHIVAAVAALWHGIWKSHVTHTNESCHTYEWVTSHVELSHVTRGIESRYAYEGVVCVCITLTWSWPVMTHAEMSRVTNVNEFVVAADVVAVLFTLVAAHWRSIWMSHVTRRKKSYHTWNWVTLRIEWVGCVCSILTWNLNESCHKWKCIMTHIEINHVT